MSNWIEKFEQIIKDHQLVSIIVATFIGSFWGIWHSVSQAIENPARHNKDYPEIRLKFSCENLQKIKNIILCLFIRNILIATLIFYPVIAFVFFILNKLFEFVLVQILIAISISYAITRKKGNIRLLDAFMGGFDLKDFPILGPFITSIFESYEESYTKHFDQLRVSCDEIFDSLIEEEFAKAAKQAARSEEIREKDMQISEDEIIEQITSRLLHWEESRKFTLQEEFEKIKNLPDERDRKINLLRFKDKIYGKD